MELYVLKSRISQVTCISFLLLSGCLTREVNIKSLSSYKPFLAPAEGENFPQPTPPPKPVLPRPLPPSPIPPSAPGVIQSLLENRLCVDIRHASMANGTTIQIYQCNGSNAQQWIFDNGNLKAFGKCLSVTANNLINGAAIVLSDCQSLAGQKWILQGKELKLSGTSRCVAVAGGTDEDSTPLLLRDCNNSSEQQWKFSAAPDSGPPLPPNPNSPITPSGANSGKYKKLVWSDEFDGTGGVDPAKWNVEVNCNGGGNHEWQCYTNNLENISRDGNGNLVIQVIQHSYKRGGYSSGRITSRGKGDWTYGRFESKIKIASGRGLWPAFWMMPTTSSYGTWPTSGELDIMEILGHDPAQLYSTFHYGASSPHTKLGGGNKGPDLSQDFHVYAIERDANQIRAYVDDKYFFTMNDTDSDFWNNTQWAGRRPPDGAKWPFSQAFFLILNHAVGGDWPGDPDRNIQSGKMVVNYVRVFQ